MCQTIIVVLVGLPGAGKTTFAKSFEAYFPSYQVTIFHYDELCTNFSASERKLVFSKVRDVVIMLGQCTCEKQNVIIIDDNNYYKSMQYEFLQLCRSYTLGFLIVYFNVSLERALKQNQARNEKLQVDMEVIKNMFAKLEAPEKGQNAVHIESIENCNLKLIKEHIEFAFKNPQKMLQEKCKEPMTISKLQEVDLILRKLVGKLIKQCPKKAIEYNNAKKQLYLNIKQGEVTLSANLEESLLKYFPLSDGEQTAFIKSQKRLETNVMKPSIEMVPSTSVKQNIITSRTPSQDKINKIQQIDLVLRQIVNRKVKENPLKAKEFNNIKKELFKRIKEGAILDLSIINDSNDEAQLEIYLSKCFT